MKTMKQKIFLILMLTISVSFGALWQGKGVLAGTLTESSGSCGENCTYTFDSKTGTVTISGTGECSFSSGCYDNIVNVVIENGVTSIGEWAFDGCTGLTSITLPNSVTSIGDCAFFGCKGLTSITLPDSVKSIGESAFSGCTGLTSITLPNGVTSIGRSAFSGCEGLTSITLPDSVTSVGEYAFPSYQNFLIYCSDKLKADATFKENYKDYWVISPSSKVVEENIGQNLKATIDSNTFTITVDGKGGVYSDYRWPYYLQFYIKNVVINADMDILDRLSFVNYKKIETATFDEGSKGIPAQLFYGCSNLKTFIIPKTIKYIDLAAFYNCSSLKELIIPEGVKSIVPTTFSGCTSLEKLTIPESAKQISKDAFEHCDKLTIYCVKGSAAEKFAKTNNIKYVSVKSTNKKTKYNIKNKKTYKKTQTIKISDADKIDTITLNGRPVKVKSGVKSFSFKLSKYKKSLLKKKKFNILVVTDLKGVENTIKFKVK
ncbi:MAG: leucine-rich repeat domain-containing protein [Lachnospiraceae bacterium]|nr:leucine-rich repeat domain-containing protein [Lachnospiraceae bacterium]